MFDTQGMEGYLSDESGCAGQADYICFPTGTEQIAAALEHARRHELAVTIQGARTGIFAGCVPTGGMIINLSRHTRISCCGMLKDNALAVTVSAGVTVDAMNAYLKDNGYGGFFLPVNPTETTATLGGMAATNALGSYCRKYGDMRKAITAMTVVLPDGSIVCYDRNNPAAFASGLFKLGSVPVADSLYAVQAPINGDLIDMVCGAEGTAGVISSMTLRLTQRPAHIYGLLAYFDDLAQAQRFIDTADRESMLCAEYFHSTCFDILCRQAQALPAAAQMAALRQGGRCALWCEFGADDDEALFTVLEDAYERLINTGAPAELALAATDPREYVYLSSLKHTLTELANMLSFRQRKHVVNALIPQGRYVRVAKSIQDDLEKSGIPSVVMGHIGIGHLLVRLLPEDSTQHSRAAALVSVWNRRLRQNGCRCCSEYGIGRSQRGHLRAVSPDAAESINRVRDALDKNRLLNREVLTTS